MDPVLARRLARQEEKIKTGQSELADVGRCQRVSSNMEPELARRLAKQHAKVHTGESTVKDVGSTVHSGSRLDPELTQRLVKRQQHFEMPCDDNPFDNLGSAADQSIHLDPELIKRLAKQQLKVVEGLPATSSVMSSRRESTAESGIDVVDAKLAMRLSLQRRKADCDSLSLQAAPEAATYTHDIHAASSVEFVDTIAREHLQVDDGLLPTSSTRLQRKQSKIGSDIDIVDSELARRMSLQRQKADGETSLQDAHTSSAQDAQDMEAPEVRNQIKARPGIEIVDSELARRMSMQRDKVDGVEDLQAGSMRVALDTEKFHSKVDSELNIVDSELSKRLSLQRQKVDGEVSVQNNQDLETAPQAGFIECAGRDMLQADSSVDSGEWSRRPSLERKKTDDDASLQNISPETALQNEQIEFEEDLPSGGHFPWHVSRVDSRCSLGTSRLSGDISSQGSSGSPAQETGSELGAALPADKDSSDCSRDMSEAVEALPISASPPAKLLCEPLTLPITSKTVNPFGILARKFTFQSAGENKNWLRAAISFMMVLITATLVLTDRWLLSLFLRDTHYHAIALHLCKQSFAMAVVELLAALWLSPWLDD